MSRQEPKAGLADWAKFAVAVVSGCAATLFWVESRFVSRVEWAAAVKMQEQAWESHTVMRKATLDSIQKEQTEYAANEKLTAASLASINVKLTVIDTRQQVVLERIAQIPIRPGAKAP